VNTDTRTLRPSNLFVALKGERFDGHRFLDLASRQGAGAMVVNYDSAELSRASRLTVPLILVPDTGKALQALAAGYRQQFSMPLVVVVGSNGKTTAKEMIHSIFKTHCALLGNDRAAHCTVGNFNNEIGLPLTLLRINEHHRYSTVELGMNHPGETAVLARIAAPSIVLINNAQREHQEFMQTVEAVAQEHADAISALADNGVVVLPAQDTHSAIWRSAAQSGKQSVIDFALHTEQDRCDAQVSGTRTEQGLRQQLRVSTPIGQITIVLNAAGEHNARNALAAISVALAANIPLSSITAGLQEFEPVKGRMQQHRVGQLTVIDDSYNANPDSVAAAIRVLAPFGPGSVLVLGDMGEVGDQGAQFHTEAGADAAAQGVAALYTLGELSQYTHLAFQVSGKPCQHFDTPAALNTFLTSGAIAQTSTVLIKGSRFMRMELTVDALLNRQDTASGGH
jgi:UDP-N-acetylmuramoyl-tripeptide--D-alanyl-D-alanine ligase